jgi:hypothetical protein
MVVEPPKIIKGGFKGKNEEFESYETFDYERNIRGIKLMILGGIFGYQIYDLGRIVQGLDKERLEDCCNIIHGCK